MSGVVCKAYLIVLMLYWNTSAARNMSIHLCENINIADVVFEIARENNIDLTADINTIQNKSVIYKVSNKSPQRIIKEICDLLQLVCVIKEKQIHIFQNKPYWTYYDIQIGNAKRVNDTQKTVPKGENEGITSYSEINPWIETENNIQKMIADEKNAQYAMNKSTGILSIYAKQAKHKQIESYINKIKEAAKRQLLIEAKIIEVTLNEAQKGGISWETLLPMLNKEFVMENVQSVIKIKETKQPIENEFIINMLSSFGSTKLIAHPKITVLNNQPAFIKITTDEISIKPEVLKADTEKGKSAVVFHPVVIPVGLTMIAQASIDDQKDIVLNIKTSLSHTEHQMEFLTFVGGEMKEGSSMPVVKRKEIDSVAKLSPGDTLVIGGIMEEAYLEKNIETPILSCIPIIGKIFSKTQEQRITKEIVIMLKVSEI